LLESLDLKRRGHKPTNNSNLLRRLEVLRFHSSRREVAVQVALLRMTSNL
jgi:hypothetical protein